MLYHIHELHRAAMRPARLFAEAMRAFYTHPLVPLAHTGFGRTMAAGAELVERATRDYPKPEFGLGPARVVWRHPFCTLLGFGTPGAMAGAPRVLLVAPMSGHWATLLRGTVATFLPEHEVYITDWHDAREVPLAEGRFDLDEYIDAIRQMLCHLGPDTHVVAVCQPAVPVTAALALMAAEADPCRPRSVVLMGGPIDTRINPTRVNELAASRPLDWFERTVIHTVPAGYPGAGRRVCPGFLQLQGFMSLNPERHVGEHLGLFNTMIRGDGDSAARHREFYDEYLAVMDLTAEYYLQTIQTVFIEHHLPEGRMTWRGRRVDPSAITDTALMTVEGGKDDITGPGQTEAAHRLYSGLPEAMRRHHLQPGVGHYGVFNGRRWREEIYPHVREFIRQQQERPLLEDQALWRVHPG